MQALMLSGASPSGHIVDGCAGLILLLFSAELFVSAEFLCRECCVACAPHSILGHIMAEWQATDSGKVN